MQTHTLYTDGSCVIPHKKFQDQYGEFIMLKSAKFTVPTIVLNENQCVVTYINEYNSVDASVNDPLYHYEVERIIPAGSYTVRNLLDAIEFIDIVDSSKPNQITINVIHMVDLGACISQLFNCSQVLYPGYRVISANLLPGGLWSSYVILNNKRTYLGSFPVYQGDDMATFDTNVTDPYWKCRPYRIYLPKNASKFDIQIINSNLDVINCKMELTFLTAE